MSPPRRRQSPCWDPRDPRPRRRPAPIPPSRPPPRPRCTRAPTRPPAGLRIIRRHHTRRTTRRTSPDRPARSRAAWLLPPSLSLMRAGSNARTAEASHLRLHAPMLDAPPSRTVRLLLLLLFPPPRLTNPKIYNPRSATPTTCPPCRLKTRMGRRLGWKAVLGRIRCVPARRDGIGWATNRLVSGVHFCLSVRASFANLSNVYFVLFNIFSTFPFVCLRF